MPWALALTPFDDPDADLLRRAQRQELDARYGSDDHEPGAAPSAADVPVFVVARDQEGAPVACGGLRPLPDDILGPGVVEIKRYQREGYAPIPLFGSYAGSEVSVCFGRDLLVPR